MSETVFESDASLPALGWSDASEVLEAMAAGQLQSSEVEQVLALGQRVAHPHGSGHTVLHHWKPRQSNGQAPVVLFHGGSGSWTHWVRSIGPLAEAGHDVWAVDLPGFGDSDPVAGAHDADGLIEPLGQMLEALFPQQPVQLVGFSFGGMTAGMLAAAFPHVVQQLVIVGAPGIGLSAKHPFRLKGWRHLKSPYAQLQHHVFNLGELMLRDTQAITRDTVALHVTNVQRDRLPRRRISSTDILLRSLQQVDCPVTAIYAEGDALYPGLLGEVEHLLAASARDFRGLHRVADAGHWVQYEAPEAVHALLLPMLERRPKAG
ncbi:MAG: alpha/beta hydrolase [Acidovorax sp.]|nr:alpha/beta hydrolase [Acidovorax sp.]